MGDDIVVLSYGQRGTLTSQLRTAVRGSPRSRLDQMTLEEKEFDLVQALRKASQEETSQCCETDFWSWSTSQTGPSGQTL